MAPILESYGVDGVTSGASSTVQMMATITMVGVGFTLLLVIFGCGCEGGKESERKEEPPKQAPKAEEPKDVAIPTTNEPKDGAPQPKEAACPTGDEPKEGGPKKAKMKSKFTFKIVEVSVQGMGEESVIPGQSRFQGLHPAGHTVALAPGTLSRSKSTTSDDDNVKKSSVSKSSSKK